MYNAKLLLAFFSSYFLVSVFLFALMAGIQSLITPFFTFVTAALNKNNYFSGCNSTSHTACARYTTTIHHRSHCRVFWEYGYLCMSKGRMPWRPLLRWSAVRQEERVSMYGRWKDCQGETSFIHLCGHQWFVHWPATSMAQVWSLVSGHYMVHWSVGHKCLYMPEREVVDTIIHFSHCEIKTAYPHLKTNFRPSQY